MGARFDRFVILAEMRTGSNALEERLNDYAGIESLGELFNPHFIGKPDVDELFGVSLRDRDADPRALLDVIRQRSDGLAGFRLFSDHDPRVLDACLSDRKTAKIVLTRNPLESYVSLKIARKTGQWWLSDLKSRKQGRARFDVSEFEEYLAERSAHLHMIRHRLKSTGQAFFEIDYADLGDDDLIRGCVRFLGVAAEKGKVTRKGRVQNPVSLSEKVENAAEMKAALQSMDPFDPDRFPDFEPPRGPNVPSFVTSGAAPLLYMPVKCSGDRQIRAWMAALGGEEALRTGFTQKALRSWKRQTGAHASFTVVAHPVARAHDAFCRFILPVGQGSFSGIRTTLRRTYKLPIPDDSSDSGYDLASHADAFLAFLKFLKGNLSGQTAVRVDAAWASQSASVRGLAEFALPDRICRAESLSSDLAEISERVGIDAPALPVVKPEGPHSLSDIYNDRIERAARAAYQRDYMMFGYGPWRDSP